LAALVAAQAATIERLEARVVELEGEVAELKRRLAEVPAVVTAEIGRDSGVHRGLRPFLGVSVSSPITVRSGV